MSRIEAVFRKEVSELLSNRGLVFSFLGLVLFFVIIPVGLMGILVSGPQDVAKEEENEVEWPWHDKVPKEKQWSDVFYQESCLIKTQE